MKYQEANKSRRVAKKLALPKKYGVDEEGAQYQRLVDLTTSEGADSLIVALGKRRHQILLDENFGCWTARFLDCSSPEGNGLTWQLAILDAAYKLCEGA